MKLKLRRTMRRLDTLASKLYLLEADKSNKGANKAAISIALTAVKNCHVQLTALKKVLVTYPVKKGGKK